MSRIISSSIMKINMCLGKNQQTQRGLTRNKPKRFSDVDFYPGICFREGSFWKSGGAWAEVCSKSPEKQTGMFMTKREGPQSVFGEMQILPVNHYCYSLMRFLAGW